MKSFRKVQACEKGVTAPRTPLPVLFLCAAELDSECINEVNELIVANVISRSTRGIKDD